jgi:hypothetical protein
MYGQISLKQYEGLNGFGTQPAADVQELAKALEAGYQVVNQTGGSALRVESLEASLKVVTYTNHHIKFWKKIPKSPAFSTVEEYNQLVTYGGTNFAFTQEGELPPATDTAYARRTQLVKFLGTTREVTHPATLVHPAHGDVIGLENQNGILWLLERVETSLFTGDSALAFDGEAEQWDGLDALIDATSFLDMEGQPLQEADIEEGTNTIIENFGYPTDLFLGTRQLSDLVKTMYPRERIQLPAPTNGQIGQAINTMATQAGVIEFNPDIFIRQLPTPPAAATHANAPATPQAATSALNATGNGDFTKGAPAAGDTEYAYIYTACNRFGESAPSPVMAATQTMTAAERTAGNQIDVTLTNAAVIGAFPPEYYRIYRTRALAAGAAVPAASTAYSLVLSVPCTNQGAGVSPAAIVDLNFLLPFTSIAYLGELTPNVLTFRQLAPMMRLDLAVLAPAYRWMILLYGTPILFAPLKWLRMVNIGTLA